MYFIVLGNSFMPAIQLKLFHIQLFWVKKLQFIRICEDGYSTSEKEISALQSACCFTEACSSESDFVTYSFCSNLFFKLDE